MTKEVHKFERRKAVCKLTDECEVADRQNYLMEEFRELRKELSEIRSDIKEVITLFNDGKAVIGFTRKAGHFVRWLALTVASIAAVWAALTNWHGK